LKWHIGPNTCHEDRYRAIPHLTTRMGRWALDSLTIFRYEQRECKESLRERLSLAVERELIWRVSRCCCEPRVSTLTGIMLDHNVMMMRWWLAAFPLTHPGTGRVERDVRLACAGINHVIAQLSTIIVIVAGTRRCRLASGPMS
jgi:hypothetical protein